MMLLATTLSVSFAAPLRICHGPGETYLTTQAIGEDTVRISLYSDVFATFSDVAAKLTHPIVDLSCAKRLVGMKGRDYFGCLTFSEDGLTGEVATVKVSNASLVDIVCDDMNTYVEYASGYEIVRFEEDSVYV